MPLVEPEFGNESGAMVLQAEVVMLKMAMHSRNLPAN